MEYSELNQLLGSLKVKPQQSEPNVIPNTNKDHQNERINHYRNHNVSFNSMIQNKQTIAGQVDFKSFMSKEQKPITDHNGNKSNINSKLNQREKVIYHGPTLSLFDMKPKMTRDVSPKKKLNIN